MTGTTAATATAGVTSITSTTSGPLFILSASFRCPGTLLRALISHGPIRSPNGTTFNVIKDIGGGDEVWHNPGDGRFYVTGLDQKATPPVQSLGVIDAETSTLLQAVKDVRGKNPAAFAENNHVFTIVQINAAIVAAPASDDSTCAQFGFRGTGCVAIFEHEERRGEVIDVSTQEPM